MVRVGEKEPAHIISERLNKALLKQKGFSDLVFTTDLKY